MLETFPIPLQVQLCKLRMEAGGVVGWNFALISSLSRESFAAKCCWCAGLQPEMGLSNVNSFFFFLVRSGQQNCVASTRK